MKKEVRNARARAAMEALGVALADAESAAEGNPMDAIKDALRAALDAAAWAELCSRAAGEYHVATALREAMERLAANDLANAQYAYERADAILEGRSR
jgi:hypothetical protein